MDNHCHRNNIFSLCSQRIHQPTKSYRLVYSFCYILAIINLVLVFYKPSFASDTKTELYQGLHSGLHIYRYDWIDEKCVLYIAEVDRKGSNLDFEVGVANDQILGKESVRLLTEKRNQRGDRRALVAVNGGFGVLGDMRGYGGVLENLHIQNYELITQPTDSTSCFGVTTTGVFLIDDVKMKAQTKLGDQILSVGAINQRREDGHQLILFTPRMGYATHTNHRGFEIVLSNLKLPVTSNYQSNFMIQQFGEKGNNPIPINGGVLSFRSRKNRHLFSQLTQGQIGEIRISLDPPKWKNVKYAIGGRLRLIKNGQIHPKIVQLHNAEKIHIPGKRSPSLVLSYEPRTALGFNKEKLILIVADGRQPNYSTGLSLYRLAEILIKLGVKEAINLDGGSSSTFIVDGQLANRPSGHKERNVLNAVFITMDIKDDQKSD